MFIIAFVKAILLVFGFVFIVPDVLSNFTQGDQFVVDLVALVRSTFNPDITVGHFVLLNIDPEGGTPSTSLGPKMGIEATSLSRILKSMEEKDLIVRKPNPEDGRSVLICLTDFGIEMREYSKSVVLGFDEKVREKRYYKTI